MKNADNLFNTVVRVSFQLSVLYKGSPFCNLLHDFFSNKPENLGDYLVLKREKPFLSVSTLLCGN